MDKNQHILKVADDMVIVSLLQDQELGNGSTVKEFISWHQQSLLYLHISATKD